MLCNLLKQQRNSKLLTELKDFFLWRRHFPADSIARLVAWQTEHSGKAWTAEWSCCTNTLMSQYRRPKIMKIWASQRCCLTLNTGASSCLIDYYSLSSSKRANRVDHQLLDSDVWKAFESPTAFYWRTTERWQCVQGRKRPTLVTNNYWMEFSCT